MNLSNLINAASLALTVVFVMPLTVIIALLITRRIRLLEFLKVTLVSVGCVVLSNALSYLGQHLSFLSEKIYIIIYELLVAAFCTLAFMLFSGYLRKHSDYGRMSSGFLFGMIKEWSYVAPVCFYDLVMFYRIQNGTIYDVLSADYSTAQIQEIVTTYSSMSAAVFFYYIFKAMVIILGYCALVQFTAENEGIPVTASVFVFNLLTSLGNYTGMITAFVLLILAAAIAAAAQLKPDMLSGK